MERKSSANAPFQFRGDNTNLINIEILRGLAALAVCIYHFCPEKHIGDVLLSHVTRSWHLGVDAFFVVSGFVIPFSLYRRGFQLRDIFRFLSNRGARLYPTLLVSFLFAIALALLKEVVWNPRISIDLSVRSILSNLTLTCDFFEVRWFNGVAWTLALEAQYYFLIALSFPLLISERWMISLGVAVVWLLLPFFFHFQGTVVEWLPVFSIGIVSFLGYCRKWPVWASLLYFSGSVLVICLTRSLESALIASLSFRPLLFLGKISYSLYLFHALIEGVVMAIGTKIVGHSPFIYLFLLFGVLMSFVISWFAFIWIEQPSHRWAQSLWGRRSKEVETVQS